MQETRERQEAAILLTRAVAILTRERAILRMKHTLTRAQQTRLGAMEQWLALYAYAYPSASTTPAGDTA